MMEEWRLRSMEEHACREGWLGDAAVHRLIESVRRLQEIEHSRYEENQRLLKEREEARDVARKVLRIARARGPEPFGLTMVPWILDPPSDEEQE